MNDITIMGHLGADPEVRFTSSGQKVTTLRIAENQKRGGNDETIWWRATIWGEQFDKMMPYFKKDSAIIAMGQMSKPEIYNDREGKPQISMNVVVSNLSFSPFGRGDRTQEGGAPAGGSYAQSAPAQSSPFQGEPQKVEQGQAAPAAPAANTFAEDEIPF